jgi:toxin ParE1/3/4
MAQDMGKQEPEKGPLAKVRWGKRALRELGEIDSFVAMQSEDGAELVAKRIDWAVMILSNQPEIGRPGRLAGTRELAVRNTPYIICYRMGGETAWILGIQRGAKSWPSRF